MSSRPKLVYNADEKFDIQLSQALIAERKLGEIFLHCNIASLELKTETWLWEETGNICIEYKCDDKPTGISLTQASCWVHELRRDGETLVYLMFPIERLKQLARDAIRRGDWRIGGDRHRQHVALIRLCDILRKTD